MWATVRAPSDCGPDEEVVKVLRERTLLPQLDECELETGKAAALAAMSDVVERAKHG
jgi:hypothetical protein